LAHFFISVRVFYIHFAILTPFTFKEGITEITIACGIDRADAISDVVTLVRSNARIACKYPYTAFSTFSRLFSVVPITLPWLVQVDEIHVVDVALPSFWTVTVHVEFKGFVLWPRF
jgi:hypothetical protein